MLVSAQTEKKSEEVMADPIYRRKEAADYLSISLTTLWEWCKAGRLPHPIKMGPRAVGWRKSTLDQFISSREAATEQAGA